jgi:hypothetical protein
MAGSTFSNHHDLILGMMANGAGIGFLVLAMRKISRLPCLFGLQDYIRRPDAYLHSESPTGEKE